MEASGINSVDTYKSYIQRRRVGSAPSEGGLIAKPEPDAERKEVSYADSYADIYRSYTGFVQNRAKSESETIDKTDDSDEDLNSTVEKIFKDDDKESTPRSNFTQSRAQTSSLNRSDPLLYKRLYGSGSRFQRTSGYTGSYHGYGAGSHAEVKDNRTTLIAITVIKQALACFALLGIIVFLQQRSDTEGVLSFIRKHVVEDHIDAQSIIASVQNLFKEASRLLGGSP